jgi:hypothetical protein
MWRRIKNFFLSFSTYADLSPNVSLRRQVERSLHDRPALTAQVWFERFWQPLQVSQPVVDFVYRHLPSYTGLSFSRVYPSDRLVEDLHLDLICWFDWELSLSEDFCRCFGIDISEQFQPNTLRTVEDLVRFLERQLLTVNRSE